MKRAIGCCTLAAAAVWALSAAGQTSPQPASAPTAPAAPTPLTITPLTAALKPSDVIAHLEKAIAWYRHVDTAAQSAGGSIDILLRDSAHQDALRALQLAFQFAHADAAFRASLRQAQSASGNPADAPAASRSIEDAAARAADRVSRLQAQIKALDTLPAAGSPKNRASLDQQRQELQSELELAQEIQKTVQSMVSFAGANTSAALSATAGFTGQINELQRSVPEAQIVVVTRKASGAGNDGSASKDGSAAATKAPAAPSTSSTTAALNRQEVIRPETQGLFGLAGTVFGASRERGAIDNLLRETDALSADVDQLKNPLVAQLRSAIKQSEDLTAAAASQSADQLGTAQKQIATLTVQFRQLSTVVVPLGEEQILVQELRGNLTQWRALINQEYDAAFRYLLLRLGMLVLAIVVLFVVSELWKRATFRYVRDARRRRQFLVIRRFVVAILFCFIFAGGLVTQFGSVATYAGFLTAGLAVALQNVILAVIAYFFLIGRYGVRVGDRVTVGGVTGDVLELGLVRIYLMELAGPAGDLHSTGRVVLFANSVLFQPQPLFKQLPGTNYVWHSITVGLAADSDVRAVEERLKEGVEQVFTNYRPELEQQHKALERSIEIDVPNPTPECRIQYTGTALQFRVRYPVELKRAGDVDAELLRSLSHVIAQEPKLTLVPDGSPRLEQSV